MFLQRLNKARKRLTRAMASSSLLSSVSTSSPRLSSSVSRVSRVSRFAGLGGNGVRKMATTATSKTKRNLFKHKPKAKPQATATATATPLLGTFKRVLFFGGLAGAAAAGTYVASTTAEANGAMAPLPNMPMAVSVYDVPLGKRMPDVVPCFIEVSRGSRNKYEWDNSMGFLKLDRVLHSAVFYPHNYGFFPQTLCGDGDPLDVLVMGDLPLVPGSIVDVRPIAYMVMEDEKGMDEKVLAVVDKSPHYSEMMTLRDVPEHVLREIAHFFSTYKALEKKKWAKVGGWKGTQDTKKLIEETHEMYLQKKKEGPIHYTGN